jgi:methionine aminopeptidase
MVPGDVQGEIEDSVEIRRKRRALQALQEARDAGLTVEEIAEQIERAIRERGY